MKNDVAALLKEFIERSGVSVSYIAKSIGVDRSTLSRYIHDRLDVYPHHRGVILGFIAEYKERIAQ